MERIEISSADFLPHPLADANILNVAKSEPTRLLAAEVPEIDPIYGIDAAKKYVSDHFDAGHSFTLADKNKAASNHENDMTIFVNLAANRGLLNSSLREDDEIQKLTPMTKDSPVKIVVQVAMNRDRSLNHLVATTDDMIINNLGGLDPDVSQIEVVRYEIANGAKKLLSSGHAQGLTEDLADLLSADPEAMKANKIMLFDRSHGMAMHGLRGDAGNTPVDDLQFTLKNALKASGKDSFDVIDFDACLMANAQTLTKLAPVVKYTIASEEPEVAVALAADPHSKKKPKPTGSNAQPITEAIRKMIKDPTVEPRAAALQIADTNKEQCRKISKDGLCGANTLGVYDESKAPRFSESLDQLGKTLTDTMALGNNERMLQSAVLASPKIDGEPDGMGAVVVRRDLGSFVKNIKSGLDSGSITDTADGTMREAVDKFQTSMSDLIVSHFNSFKPALVKRFKEVGLPAATVDGISAFIPEKQLCNTYKVFENHLNGDAIASQPNWNQFLKVLGTPTNAL